MISSYFNSNCKKQKPKDQSIEQKKKQSSSFGMKLKGIYNN